MNGSIVKRGNKYSVVVYAYNYEGVKSQHWISGFNTKKEAKEYLSSYNSRLKVSNTLFKRITLADYLIHWLDVYSVQKGLAVNTVRGYRVNIVNHIIPSVGKYYLEEINADILDMLFEDLRFKGLSGTSQKYVYRTLHKAFETGVKRREIPFNFCDMIEAPKISTEATKCLTDEEMKQFTHYLFNYDISVSLPSICALLLGLRRGEVLGLKWPDIDFDNRVLSVNRTASPHKGGYIFSPCKTEKSRRQILLPDIVYNKFIEWRNIQNSFVFENTEDFVFFQCSGNLLSHTTLNKHFKKLLADCGLDNIRFHDLRHSFASYLVGSGVPINIISQMLGHSKTSTTLDIYTHTNPNQQKIAVDFLNNING